MSEDQPISFFDELKRRNVFRVGIAYAVIAWVVAQVAELALDSFAAPGWVMKTILLVLALGFPLALFFSWAFELTPEGIKKEQDVDRSRSIARRTSRKLDFAVIGALALALVYFVANHDWSGDRPNLAATAGPKTIAVLPFTNMSDSEENAFFASGVQEDILTYLAKVADLRVISRTTVRQYANEERDLKAIAAKLGVNHIVEGSVRRAGNKVRVTAQLIDAQTDQHVWAESYDRDLTDVFEIQSAVAKEIVAALRANLSPDEQAAMNRVPTWNIDAYDLYLKARAITRDTTYSRQQIEQIEPLLAQAVELDPLFALAHAALGAIHTNFYWLGIDDSDERLQSAKVSIDKAFELQPNLPEARAALAEYYYRGFRNYPRALDELQAALERFPNNAEVLHIMGVTQRRLGHWDAAIESMRASTQLDPGNVQQMDLLLETMTRAHQWDVASAYAEEVIAAYPNEGTFRARLADILASGYGDLASAGELLNDAEPVQEINYLGSHLLLRVSARDYDGAFDLLGDYQEALGTFPGAGNFVRSWLHALRGDEAEAKEYAAKTIEELAPLIAGGDVGMSDAQLLVAEAHIRLDQFAQAAKIAEHVVQINPLDGDHFAAPGRWAWAARIIAMSGDTERGINRLAEVAGKPGGPSKWDLHLQPNWDVFRDNPRFAALAAVDAPSDKNK